MSTVDVEERYRFERAAVPYDTIVRITDRIGGVAWQASGVLIAPDQVLTASHVVYIQGQGSATDIVVTPGYSGTAPFGTAIGNTVHYLPISNAGRLISFHDSQSDYAVIHLDHSFAGLGTIGLQANFAGRLVNVAGFPASVGGALINSSQIVSRDASYSLLHGTALGAGSSGGPMWIQDSLGQPYVVGLVSSANSVTSRGNDVLITTSAFDMIETWLQADTGNSPTSAPRVRNTAANVADEMTQLESPAQQGKLASITLTDPGLPRLNLSLAQLLGSIDALSFIGGSFAVDVSATGVRGSAPSLLAASLGSYLTIADVQFADGQVVYDPAAPAAQIFRLYQAALGRAPDPAGLHSWVAAVKVGTPLAALAAGFIASPEFQLRACTGLDDGGFISQLYLNVLHRAPDPPGFAGWAKALVTGTSRAQAVVGFSESVENKLATAASVQAGIWDLDRSAPQVARLHDTVFGRLLDAGGLANGDHAIDAGALTLDQVAAQFAQSVELMAICGPVSNSAFVTALYANALHRAPDAGGQASWTGALDTGGMTRSGTVLGFSESQEHQSDTAGSIFGTDTTSLGVQFV